jgi:AraC family transcriptional regulator of adaptative response/methylated-DNA-[protein]-cysteine methyltransferase
VNKGSTAAPPTQPQADRFDQVARAIAYAGEHYRAQPTLADMASAAGLSPHHFQRLFTAWAGVSPKKFIQYLSLEHAKSVLREPGGTVLDATYATGLSGPGRLHDLFVRIEQMTPGEFGDGGAKLCINYRFDDSPFGAVFVASTARGVCHLSFADSKQAALAGLRQQFPRAELNHVADTFQSQALEIFRDRWSQLDEIRLHLRASPFQLKVWESLLSIPYGRLATYGAVAASIGQPTASRAVGTAIGQNPVAYLIPCHRVIRASGQLGGYRWRPERKAAIVGREAAMEFGDD